MVRDSLYCRPHLGTWGSGSSQWLPLMPLTYFKLLHWKVLPWESCLLTYSCDNWSYFALSMVYCIDCLTSKNYLMHCSSFYSRWEGMCRKVILINHRASLRIRAVVWHIFTWPFPRNLLLGLSLLIFLGEFGLIFKGHGSIISLVVPNKYCLRSWR